MHRKLLCQGLFIKRGSDTGVFLWALRNFLKQLFSRTPLVLLFLKTALSGVRPFLATESPLKLMKNAFYFILKAFFFLKIFKLLS